MFLEIQSLLEVNDKYLIKDIFIPEICSKFAVKDNSSSIVTMLIKYTEEFIKMKDTLKNHSLDIDKLSNLNVFIEIDDGMLLVDEVYESINNDI